MDLISRPETADNSENSLKCSRCGNTILIGSEDGSEQKETECDVCHTKQIINRDRIYGSSNEDY